MERKNDPKAALLENGLSPSSAPAGHTPVTATPKASAANQQIVTTGITHPETFSNLQSKSHMCVFNFPLMSFLNAESTKPPAKNEDLVLSVLIGLCSLEFSFLNC